jgi:hypothetical protein
MMHVSPTNEMPESQSLQVETPDIVTEPVDWWDTHSAIPPFACDCCKDWSDYIDFFDKKL